MRFGPCQNYLAQSKSLILHIIHEIAGLLLGRHDAWLGDFRYQVLCQLQITTNPIPKGANPYRIPNRLCGHVDLHAQGRLLNHHGKPNPSIAQSIIRPSLLFSTRGMKSRLEIWRLAGSITQKTQSCLCRRPAQPAEIPMRCAHGPASLRRYLRR